MHIQTVDVGNDEKIAVASLCLSDDVLAAISQTWEYDTFATRWANVVARWAVEHYKKYNKAPGKVGILALYEEWAESADKDTASLVQKWMHSLDVVDISDEYAIDLIARLAKKSAAKKLAEQIQGALSNGKVEEAAALAESWKPPKVGQRALGVDLLDDPEAVEAAWASLNQSSLIRLDGALGEFFGPTLCRDSFIAFVGAEKSGKSTHIYALGWQGVLQGKRVAVFNLGDLSAAQLYKRFMVTAVRRPSFACKARLPLSINYDNKQAVVGYKERVATRGFTKEEGLAAFKKIAGNDPKRLRVHTSPAGTLSAFDIDQILGSWADSGWVPDIVVVDYADIMAWPAGVKDQKDAIDMNWRQLRAISTKYKTMVLSATQCDTDGYSTWLLQMDNFSGSKTKNAHVTAMVGINMTAEEKSLGVCRLNHVALRDSEYMTQRREKVVAVAGCTLIGDPHMVSCWV